MKATDRAWYSDKFEPHPTSGLCPPLGLTLSPHPEHVGPRPLERSGLSDAEKCIVQIQYLFCIHAYHQSYIPEELYKQQCC